MTDEPDDQLTDLELALASERTPHRWGPTRLDEEPTEYHRRATRRIREKRERFVGPPRPCTNCGTPEADCWVGWSDTGKTCCRQCVRWNLHEVAG